MWRKGLLIIIILISAYTYVMINHPSDFLESMGYKQALEVYARQVSTRTNIQVIYNPGLRKLDMPREQVKIKAVIPKDHNDHQQEMAEFMRGDYQAIVECSSLDSWHTTSQGKEYLPDLRKKAYRVVIFDGGHHLPTLGMAPDIIIIPQMAGYAVHTYMLDGIKVDTIKKLAAASNSSAVIVAVPRLGLVKSESSLVAITHRVLQECSYRQDEVPFKPACQPRVTKTAGVIFAYINKDYADNINLLVKNCQSLGLRDVHKIYLAFNYNCISEAEAGKYSTKLEDYLHLPVSRVNDPVKTANVLFWGEKDALSNPGHYFKKYGL